MGELFASLRQTLTDPQRLHAALVHVPIALSLAGTVLVVILACTGGRSGALRLATLAVYAIALGAAVWAASVGEAAEDRVSEAIGSRLTPEAHETLERHEAMGEKVWIGLAASAGMVLLSVVSFAWVRTPALVLALLLSTATAGWVGLTGHYGGALVYEHGVGVPRTPNNLPPAAARVGPDSSAAPSGRPDTQPATGPSGPGIETPDDPPRLFGFD